MEIIIGREEGARRLHCIADGREFNIGAAGSVPTSVSRKHCKIIVNGSQITVENLKPQNVTFIDGLQVFSKTTTADCKLQLGTEKYNVSLRQVIQLATGKPQPVGGGIQPQLSAGTFSLRPLKAVCGKSMTGGSSIYRRLRHEMLIVSVYKAYSQCSVCVWASSPV